MLVQRFFHLDCHSVIPECGYQCDKCIAEILDVVEDTQGVSEVFTGQYGNTSGIIVRHDPEIVSENSLINALSKLPSFYKEHFIPQVLDI